MNQSHLYVKEDFSSCIFRYSQNVCGDFINLFVLQLIILNSSQTKIRPWFLLTALGFCFLPFLFLLHPVRPEFGDVGPGHKRVTRFSHQIIRNLVSKSGHTLPGQALLGIVNSRGVVQFELFAGPVVPDHLSSAPVDVGGAAGQPGKAVLFGKPQFSNASPTPSLRHYVFFRLLFRNHKCLRLFCLS